jgi:hypothetical protein
MTRLSTFVFCAATLAFGMSLHDASRASAQEALKPVKAIKQVRTSNGDSHTVARPNQKGPPVGDSHTVAKLNQKGPPVGDSHTVAKPSQKGPPVGDSHTVAKPRGVR